MPKKTYIRFVKLEDGEKAIQTDGFARITFITFDLLRRQGLSDEEIWEELIVKSHHLEDRQGNKQIKAWLEKNKVEFVGVREIMFDSQMKEGEIANEFVFRFD